MLEDLARGEDDPEALAAHAKGKLRDKLEALQRWRGASNRTIAS